MPAGRERGKGRQGHRNRPPPSATMSNSVRQPKHERAQQAHNCCILLHASDRPTLRPRRRSWPRTCPATCRSGKSSPTSAGLGRCKGSNSPSSRTSRRAGPSGPSSPPHTTSTATPGALLCKCVVGAGPSRRGEERGGKSAAPLMLRRASRLP